MPGELAAQRHVMAGLIEFCEVTSLRLPLGSDAYDDGRAALIARLAGQGAHRDVMFPVVQDELK